MKKKVRNISKEPQTVVGIGVIMPDTVISVPNDFHNANFKEVKEDEEKDKKKKITNKDK